MADERGEVDRGARLLDLGQRFADVERRAAAVAGHDGRDAHADEVLGAGVLGQVVSVGVDVDESRCDDEVGGVDGLAPVARIDLADGGDSARGDRDVGLALRRTGAVHDSPADDDHVIPRSRDWSLGKGGEEQNGEKTGTLTFFRRGLSGKR